MQINPRETDASDIDSLTRTCIDFEEKSSHQDSVISYVCQRPDKSYFQEPPELQSQVDTGKLVQKLVPKQADMDKVIK